MAGCVRTKINQIKQKKNTWNRTITNLKRILAQLELIFMHIDKLNMKTVYLQQQLLLFKMLVFVLEDKKSIVQI